MRALVQGNPFMAQFFRNPKPVAPKLSAATVAPKPSAATVAPQPRPTAAAPKTRESHQLGRGHDGSMDSPAAQHELSEDRDIHHTRSSAPTPKSALLATTISLSSPLAATAPAPTTVPSSTSNPRAPQHSMAAESRDTTYPNAANTVRKGKGGRADASDPKQPDQPALLMSTTPRPGRSRRGRHST